MKLKYRIKESEGWMMDKHEDNEDMDICQLCQEKDANFDDYLCSSCAHDMWEHADEIRDIIGYICWWCEYPEDPDDFLVQMDKYIEQLRQRMTL
jgi:hypothetical protein